MKFGDYEHLARIDALMKLWGGLRALSDLAAIHGIDDIFQDNGAKTLQQIVLANFRVLDGREGNDAVDEEGVEWEMKSANVNKVGGFSTHHHLNFAILAKYRSVPWLFSIYSHIELREMYVMRPEWLEPCFLVWQNHLEGKKITRQGLAVPAVSAINNPKIPVKFVTQNGVCIYRDNLLSRLNPSEALRSK